MRSTRPVTSGSGIDNVFMNSKWLIKASGMYTLPWDINLAGNYQYRQGYPFLAGRADARRARTGAGTANVLLTRSATCASPSLYTLDFKVDKVFGTFGSMKVIPSMDIFNITNVNTVLARRRVQNASKPTTSAASSRRG